MASLQEHGEVSVRVYNPANKNSRLLITRNSRIVGYVAPASHTNPQEQDEKIAFGEGGVAVDEKQYLEVWFKPEAADIIESGESTLLLDITIVDKRTGVRVTQTLTFENMTGFTSAGTVDLSLLASEDRRVAYYEVPTGSQLILGHPNQRGKFYCYLGDDTA